MRKSYAAILLGAMVALSACGSQAGETANTTAAQTESAAPETEAAETEEAETEEASKEETNAGTEGSGETEESADGESAAENGAAEGGAAESAGAAESESSEAAGTEAAAAVSSTASASHKGFVFQSGETLIGMNEDSAAALSELGAWSNYAETTSCAFKGLDKTYSYPGFDLYTYPLNGTDNVNSIYFTDDSAATAEGIRIGSTKEEMEAAYGTDYTEEFGVYTYTKDDSTLSFIVTDGIVESVEYTAITPQG